MATTNMPSTGLTRCLTEAGLVSAEEARAAAQESSKAGTPLVTWLVQNGIASSADIAYCAARAYGTPLLDLAAFDAEAIPRHLVDEKLVTASQALPIFLRGNRLFVAVSDPSNRRVLDEIKFQTGIATEEVLVEDDKLANLIDKLTDNQETGLELDDLDLDLETIEEDEEAPSHHEGTADDTPVVRFINKMLVDAVNRGASDIHFEPFEKSYRVRFRADGVLHEVARPPVTLGPRISARLKVMSRMDISERRLPQDGRIKLKISRSRAIDFRINTLPVLSGEKLCLRILDPSATQLGIDSLGYEDSQKALFLEALHRPQGMLLVTGPTGSGKTISLYTGLNLLNTPERNISTVEDPVEIHLEGINQCAVNYKAGLDFGEALRAFLRQDPDILMLGEIRDLETANIAIKAAQTGHMVMSTLHTLSAPETLSRLRNMGVPAWNLATSINLVVAQRLARRLCSCKIKQKIPATALLEAGFSEEQLAAKPDIYGPGGCEKCHDGYKGRVGIYEVMKVTPEIASVIMADGNSLDIARVSREAGFSNIFESALKKVQQGVTSLEEIDRVTSGH